MADEKIQPAQSVTVEKFALTEADIREFCAVEKIPYVLVVAAWRQMGAGNVGIGLGDVLYVMWQGKQMGLPPGGNWFSLIPATDKDKEKGKTGPTVCFKVDAALYILSHHPRVESYIWWWTDGAGNIYDQTHPPFFTKKQPSDQIPQIDFELMCTVSVKMRQDKPEQTEADLTRAVSCRYRDWAQNYWKEFSQWVTKPSHMLWKQTIKLFVRTFLGAALEFDDDRPPEEPGTVTIERPEIAGPAVPALPAAREATLALPANFESEIESITSTSGFEVAEIRAAAKEFISNGGRIEDFRKSFNLPEPQPETKPETKPEPRPEPQGYEGI